MTLIRIPVDTDPGKCQKYMNPMTWFAEKICLPAFDNPKNGSLLYAMLIIILYWSIAYWMDKRKIYVKV
jgi:predicted acyltransferase